MRITIKLTKPYQTVYSRQLLALLPEKSIQSAISNDEVKNSLPDSGKESTGSETVSNTTSKLVSQDSLKQSGMTQGSSLPELLRSIVGQVSDDRNLTPGTQFLMAEFQKSVEEIRMKQEQEDAWILNKLIYVGVLLAGFVIHIMLHGQAAPTNLIHNFLRHNATVVMLAAAFLGSLITDMHIRSLRIVINENGLWMAHYVEPIMLGNDGSNCEKSWQQGYLVGWENFLRMPNPDILEENKTSQPVEHQKPGETSGICEAGPSHSILQPVEHQNSGKTPIPLPKSGGHHTDLWFAILFWPNVFLITNMVYLAFAYVFFWQVFHCPSQQTSNGNIGPENYVDQQLRVGSYYLVHWMILICAFSTHIVPSIFRLRPIWGGIFPSLDEPSVPIWICFQYLILAGVLFLCSYITWRMVRRSQ